jgi:hypothetical protein
MPPLSVHINATAAVGLFICICVRKMFQVSARKAAIMLESSGGFLGTVTQITPLRFQFIFSTIRHNTARAADTVAYATNNFYMLIFLLVFVQDFWDPFTSPIMYSHSRGFPTWGSPVLPAHWTSSILSTYRILRPLLRVVEPDKSTDWFDVRVASWTW